jgi:hypothetical protein
VCVCVCVCPIAGEHSTIFASVHIRITAHIITYICVPEKQASVAYNFVAKERTLTVTASRIFFTKR